MSRRYAPLALALSMIILTSSMGRTAAAQSGPEECIDGRAGSFECSNVNLLSWMSIEELGGNGSTTMNDVWGWVDPETGREYAIVGRSDGSAIVDVTNPTSPVLIATVPTETVSTVWRDAKVYANNAFIVADAAGWHGMQVVDLTRVRDVEHPPVIFTPDTVYSEFGSAHNIEINVATGFAYVVGISVPNFFEEMSCGGGLHMIDIRVPTEPTFAGCFADDRTGRAKPPQNVPTGYTHDVQCVIYEGPDDRYVGRELCFGANETAISIADVTDKSEPVAISYAAYPNVGYAHQGWLTEDHRYFLLDDELDEAYFASIDRTRTIIFDLIDLENPVVLLEHFGEAYAIDHNQYIVGNHVFQANYTSGLRVLDITEITAPKEVGYFVTYMGHSHGKNAHPIIPVSLQSCHDDCEPGKPIDAALSFSGAWSNYPFLPSGNVLVSSIGEGLFVLDVSSAVELDAELPPAAGNEPVAQVYPNPADDEATVSWRDLTDFPRGIAIYDALGRRVQDIGDAVRAHGSARFSVRSLPPGLYFVRMDGNDGGTSTPFIVVR
jgi:choice-of-anchor B domain-containing protein